LLDIAPTLLSLAGHPVPESMQGQALLDGAARACVPAGKT